MFAPGIIHVKMVSWWILLHISIFFHTAYKNIKINCFQSCNGSWIFCPQLLQQVKTQRQAEANTTFLSQNFTLLNLFNNRQCPETRWPVLSIFSQPPKITCCTRAVTCCTRAGKNVHGLHVKVLNNRHVGWLCGPNHVYCSTDGSIHHQSDKHLCCHSALEDKRYKPPKPFMRTWQKQVEDVPSYRVVQMWSAELRGWRERYDDPMSWKTCSCQSQLINWWANQLSALPHHQNFTQCRL